MPLESQRRRLRVLQFLSAAFVPLFPLLCAVVACWLTYPWINRKNPMALAFKTSFTVRNATSRPITVTPIGAVGSEGRRLLLPLLEDHPDYVPLSLRTRFVIPAGESHVFHYDWDDINLAELLVHTEDGVRALPLDPEPTANQYRPPSQDLFIVEGVDAIPLPEAKHLAALRWHWPGVFVFLLLVSPVGLVLFIWVSLRLRKLSTH